MRAISSSSLETRLVGRLLAPGIRLRPVRQASPDSNPTFYPYSAHEARLGARGLRAAALSRATLNEIALPGTHPADSCSARLLQQRTLTCPGVPLRHLFTLESGFSSIAAEPVSLCHVVDVSHLDRGTASSAANAPRHCVRPISAFGVQAKQ
jgi:hypothetical protein